MTAWYCAFAEDHSLTVVALIGAARVSMRVLLANQRPAPFELPSAALHNPGEHQICQRFGVLSRGGLVLHEKAVIERPIQSIQQKIQIYILSQLTVRLLSPQQLLRFLSARGAPDG